MPRNLDLSALRSFLTVAELDGVTRAAGQLNLTQSAVSMQLKRLEESMGLSLLDRSARQIGLTPEGELLLSYARRLLALNDEAWGRLLDDGYEGTIEFGVPHDIVYPHIPQVLKRFSAEYPKVKVNLNSSYTTNLIAAYEAGEADLILTTEFGTAKGAEHLDRMPLVWVGAVDGRAWKQRPLRLASCRYCAFRPYSIDALDNGGLPWEMAVSTENQETVNASISADLAIEARLAIHVPEEMEIIAHDGALPDLPAFDINLYVHERPNMPFVADLAQMLREAYG